MSITAKPSPNLLSMPNENLEKICAYAVDNGDDRKYQRRGKEWLRAVRLTCKQLYPSATAEFAERFFTIVKIMVARSSLETLLEVCNHPIIGPYVSGISLCCGRLDQKLLRRNLGFYLGRKHLSGIRRARSRLQMFMDFLEEEVEFEHRRGIFQLLVNALAVIRTNGHRISLEVFDLAFYGRLQILGSQEAVTQISEDREATLQDMFTCGSRSSLHTLLAAATKSGCYVHTLSLNISDVWSEIAPSHPGRDDFLLSRAQGTFLNMQLFSLHVSANFFRDDINGLAGIILSLTKHLKFLCLWPGHCPDEWWHEYTTEALGKAIKSFQSDCLTRIELVEAFIRQGDLISLLERHIDTLENIHLSDCVLMGSWDEVMNWIRDHCSLDWLDMGLLYEFDEDSREPVRAATYYYGQPTK